VRLIVQKWSTDKLGQLITSLQNLFDRGGFIFGAFSEKKLVGVAALDSRFIGSQKDTLDLAGLWVSSQYRKKGKATTLLKQIIEKAKFLGAKKLYISATPSYNTVTFYFNRGAKLTEEINEEKFQLEPDDIHLEMSLT